MKIKVSHESPLSMLDASLKYNDYCYALVHLFEKYPEYFNFFQKAKGNIDGIVINAAGYTHTSVAILDALLAIKLPTIEVHITNIYNREDFRKKSLISEAAKGIICGFGVKGYIMALDSMKELLVNENK